jgi:hypothetical protein
MWATIVVTAAIAGSIIFSRLPPMPPGDGPLTAMQALLVTNGAMAIVLSVLASRLRVRGARLGLVLFVAFFCLSVGMMMIETLYFNKSVRMPMDLLVLGGVQGVISAAIAGAVGALLYHPADEAPAPVPANIFPRIMALTVIYVVLYYGAGYFIAWQSAAVRAYYSNMNILLVPTIALQLFRGFLWALISLYIVTRMRGSLMSRALTMAVVFWIVTSIQLLYPNALMPWAVRQMHLVEVGSSEFVYGFLAVFVLLAGARKPLSKNSLWRLIAGRTWQQEPEVSP